MSNTTNLGMPLIAAAQSQKHVTHNEALDFLDTLVQLSVIDKDLTAPPVSPSDSDRYIVGPSATGDWTGKDSNIASYIDGAWEFFPPKIGWLVWIADEFKLAVWGGSSWDNFDVSGSFVEFTDLVDGTITQLGVNASSDATNKFVVASTAILFNHIGNSCQQKINKNAAGDSASILFQSNWSGRAEFGITGDDDFHMKVSPDGSSWYEGITIDRNNGNVDIAVGAEQNAVRTISGATGTISINDRIIAVPYTTTGTVDLTLPTGSAAWSAVGLKGSVFTIMDTGAKAGTNRIRLLRDTGDAETIITTVKDKEFVDIDIDGGSLNIMMVSATEWKVF